MFHLLVLKRTILVAAGASVHQREGRSIKQSKLTRCWADSSWFPGKYQCLAFLLPPNLCCCFFKNFHGQFEGIHAAQAGGPRWTRNTLPTPRISKCSSAHSGHFFRKNKEQGGHQCRARPRFSSPGLPGQKEVHKLGSVSSHLCSST